ncbi:DegT/DnrJ/EryC1/StrS family aminotransferase [Labilibaculum euxinus]
MGSEIVMVDLIGQYTRLKDEIDSAINRVLLSGKFINGPNVSCFSEEFAQWMGIKHVIPCANGTDALQLAIMALQLQPGDEVIVPSFTYVATVEVISLLGLKPVFADVDPNTFNLDVNDVQKKITEKTKLIIPVHLFGQCADMEKVTHIAEKYNLKIVEDTAQAVGAVYHYSDGRSVKAGTIGDFGTTSFFPSKNLGCFGDGGALFTNSDELAARAGMMANHGQRIKYHHDVIGCNSRLDSIQAAILRIKLRCLDEFTEKRRCVAAYYHSQLRSVRGISAPSCSNFSTHVYNQFTLKIDLSDRFHIRYIRDKLQNELKKRGIPSMIYYPIPLHLQKAYCSPDYPIGCLPVSERLSETVLSIPIHTEIKVDELKFITDSIKTIMNNILINVPISNNKFKWKKTILPTNLL